VQVVHFLQEAVPPAMEASIPKNKICFFIFPVFLNVFVSANLFKISIPSSLPDIGFFQGDFPFEEELCALLK
jgi:hypothetical protein